MLVIAANALMGLVITAVYKYADALVKTFATACATATLYLLNMTLFHLPFKGSILLGVAVVFLASAIYFQAAGMEQQAKQREDEAWNAAAPEVAQARKAKAATGPLTFTCWEDGQRHKVATVLVLVAIVLIAAVSFTSQSNTVETNTQQEPLADSPAAATSVTNAAALNCPAGTSAVTIENPISAHSTAVPSTAPSSSSPSVQCASPSLFDLSLPMIRAPHRGYVALQYAGIARSFSSVFRGQLLNVVISCPYEVHLFFHLHCDLGGLPVGWDQAKAVEWGSSLTGESAVAALDHPIVRAHGGLFSFFSTLSFYESIVTLDGDDVSLSSMIKGIEIHFENFTPDFQPGVVEEYFLPDGRDSYKMAEGEYGASSQSI